MRHISSHPAPGSFGIAPGRWPTRTLNFQTAGRCFRTGKFRDKTESPKIKVFSVSKLCPENIVNALHLAPYSRSRPGTKTCRKIEPDFLRLICGEFTWLICRHIGDWRARRPSASFVKRLCRATGNSRNSALAPTISPYRAVVLWRFPEAERWR